MLERKPFITLKTALKDIPRDWLVMIEPKITRGGVLKECWIWTGCLDKNGHPVIYWRDPTVYKGHSRRVARAVAQMFWPDLKPHHEVLHHCGNLSCLNPAHLRVSAAHWTQEERKPSQELDGEIGKPIPGIHTRQKS